MSDLFRKFLGNLSAGAGYCVECLSQMYGEPGEPIRGYLSESGLVGHEAECGNCDQRNETFSASPSSQPESRSAQEPQTRASHRNPPTSLERKAGTG